jgi:flavin reductase (DIM6/NTAB) family NADH-FMN oxidoreductase RutF
VCISKVNHTYAIAEGSTAMGLHLLGTDQAELGRRFGEETGDLVDKFEGLDWVPGRYGAPLLAESAVSLEGLFSATSQSATTRLSFCAGSDPLTVAMPAYLPTAPGHG